MRPVGFATMLALSALVSALPMAAEPAAAMHNCPHAAENVSDVLTGGLVSAGLPDNWYRKSTPSPLTIDVYSLFGAVRLNVYGSDCTTLVCTSFLFNLGDAVSLNQCKVGPGAYRLHVFYVDSIGPAPAKGAAWLGVFHNLT